MHKKNEMSVEELENVVRVLSEKAPLSEEFERKLENIGMSDKERHWYRDQKEHWLGWLSEYNEPGYYDRKDYGNKNARYIFNHIMNPAMLFWLCEAAGVPKEALLLAKDAAIASKRTYPSQCAAIRKVIPWDEVAKVLVTKA